MTYRPKKSWDFSRFSAVEMVKVIRYLHAEILTGAENREELVQILCDHNVDAYRMAELLEESRSDKAQNRRRVEFVYRETQKFIDRPRGKNGGTVQVEIDKNTADLLVILAEAENYDTLRHTPFFEAQKMMPELIQKMLPQVIKAGVAFLNAQSIMEHEQAAANRGER